MPTPIFVVVAGSISDSRFAVINFSDATAATTALVPSPFSVGCVVACSNNLGNQSVGTLADSTSALAAVGDYGSGTVAIYNLANPAAPALQGTFDSGLGGVGAVAFDAQSGNRLVVGSASGSTIVLMDISQPPSSAVLSTCVAGQSYVSGGVSSIALSGNTAVAGGQGAFVWVDFSKPSSPQAVAITQGGYNAALNQPNYFQGLVAVDFDGATIAAGDGTGNVYTFDPSATYMATYGTGLDGVSSVAVETGNSVQIAAGCIPSGTVVMFTAAPGGSSQEVQIWSGPGPNPGGAVAFFGLPYLFASSVTGATVSLLDEAVWPSKTIAGVASGVSLAQSEQPTLGATAFNPVGGCLVHLLPFGRRTRRR
jgi:hypothetical protein